MPLFLLLTFAPGKPRSPAKPTPLRSDVVALIGQEGLTEGLRFLFTAPGRPRWDGRPASGAQLARVRRDMFWFDPEGWSAEQAAIAIASLELAVQVAGRVSLPRVEGRELLAWMAAAYILRSPPLRWRARTWSQARFRAGASAPAALVGQVDRFCDRVVAHLRGAGARCFDLKIADLMLPGRAKGRAG